MAAPRDGFAARLRIRRPIIQGPMSGGGSTPALAAAVSEAGGLGSLGAAYLTPDQIRADVADVRRLTDRPFLVNLFAGGREAAHQAVDAGPMLALLARRHEALGLPAPALPDVPPDPFPAQLEAVLECGVPVFSFTFGIPDAAALAELRRRGTFVMGTATTVEEAVLLAEAGVDAVVAQGSEAGGHRGTFAGPFERALVGTVALVPQVADAVGVPVVASGGIMDGRGIAAARALGAAAVQMGTAFLATAESGAPAAHKAALAAARNDATVVTRAFSGRPARGIANAFTEQVERERIPVPPFPVQNALTRPMRTAAAKAGDAGSLSLWAGQGVGLVRPQSAAALFARLVEETEEVMRGLGDAGW